MVVSGAMMDECWRASAGLRDAGFPRKTAVGADLQDLRIFGQGSEILVRALIAGNHIRLGNVEAPFFYLNMERLGQRRFEFGQSSLGAPQSPNLASCVHIYERHMETIFEIECFLSPTIDWFKHV